MAATRKLQGEIDRCLKKVTEGVETFEDIWQKVHNATNSNQKEKYEADLKKEIKKLQRLRDQIKSWIASGEIKDKSTLLDFRKLIETQMERFKVVERETKTKAYSKEGLGAAQKLDPAQKERDETAGWLTNSIGCLNLQLDQFECEVESLLAAKKKRLDKDKQDRMEDLKVKMEKHRYHVRKLETLLRMLDNMSVEVSQIRRIKDDIEYYIESSQEPDFEENEYIYDDIIGLDEIELSGVGLPSSATTDSNNSTCGSANSTLSDNSATGLPVLRSMRNRSSESSTDDKQKSRDEHLNKPLKPTAVRASNSSSLMSTQVPMRSVHNPALSNKTLPVIISENGRRSSSTPSGMGQIPSLLQIATSPPIPSLISHNHQQQNTHHHHHHVMHSGPHTQSLNSMHHQSGAQVNSSNSLAMALVSKQQQQQQSLVNSIEHHLQRNNSSSPLSSVSSAPSPGPASSPSPHQMQSHQMAHVSTLNGPISSKQVPEGMSSLKSIAQQVIDRAGLELPPDGNRVLFDGNIQTLATSEANIPPLLGVAPLGPVPLQKEHQCQFQAMESAFYHMPHPSDSERQRPYLPRSPVPTPIYYPQVPLPHSDTVEFFQRLSTETLFFIFYYMEGTKAQYLAARALKKQSWRFHTKYMMWFQRHEEPKIINEEYEQGTYIFFDYEKWGQRRKEGFTFEYKYLEDRELN